MNEPTSKRPEVLALVDSIRHDLRSAAAKFAELRAQLAELDLPDTRPECPECGYRSAMNLPSVREHRETAHGIRRDLFDDLAPPV